MAGSCPSLSKRQAPPERASQQNSQSRGLVDTKRAAGAAIERLKHLKQSINLPARLWLSSARNLTIMSAGPSSLANRWVTLQVARTARTSLGQKPSWFIASPKSPGLMMPERVHCFHGCNSGGPLAVVRPMPVVPDSHRSALNGAVRTRSCHGCRTAPDGNAHRSPMPSSTG